MRCKFGASSCLRNLYAGMKVLVGSERSVCGPNCAIPRHKVPRSMLWLVNGQDIDDVAADDDAQKRSEQQVWFRRAISVCYKKDCSRNSFRIETFMSSMRTSLIALWALLATTAIATLFAVDPFCTAVKLVVTVANQDKPATAFCSSYLSIPKVTSTTTITMVQ